MLRSRKIILISVAVVFVLLSIIYFSVKSIPSQFLSEERIKVELTESLNQTGSEITSITDIIDIDDRHKVVLFVADKEKYGKSFWQWNRSDSKWQEVHFSLYETPELWRIDEDDESSYRLIWNQHPETKVNSYRFYLLKKRGYHVSQRNGKVLKDVYEPQIQLEHSVALNGQAYGIMSLPEEWIKLIKLHKEASTNTNRRTANLFWSNSTSSFLFHFKAQDDNNDEIPEAELSNGPRFARGGSGTQVLSYPEEYFFE